MAACPTCRQQRECDPLLNVEIAHWSGQRSRLTRGTMADPEMDQPEYMVILFVPAIFTGIYLVFPRD